MRDLEHSRAGDVVVCRFDLSEDFLHVETVDVVGVGEVGLETIGREVTEGTAVGVSCSGLVDGEDGLTAEAGEG